MAKAKEKSKQEQQLAHRASTEVGAVIDYSVAVIDYSVDAGAGLEGADRESYAIPFLAVLQPLSPQVAEETVSGAKAGDIFNTVTQELFKRAVIIPCAFQRRWVHWGPREGEGGYKGEFTTAQVNEMRAAGKVKDIDGRLFFPLADGSVHEKKSDRLADTRNHYVLLLRTETDEIGSPAVLALASTGIKRSKNFLSRIESIKLRRPSDGSLYTAPSFSHMYELKSEKESNDKGTWWSPAITPIGPVTSRSVYELAKAFHAQVTAGAVQVARDTAPSPDGGATAAEGGEYRV
jgi:hypothetical protein